jgi:hypothetical protein
MDGARKRRAVNSEVEVIKHGQHLKPLGFSGEKLVCQPYGVFHLMMIMLPPVPSGYRSPIYQVNPVLFFAPVLFLSCK